MITRSTHRRRYPLACLFGVFLLLLSLGMFSKSRGPLEQTADSALMMVGLILFLAGLVSALLLPLAVIRDFIMKKRQLEQ